MVEDINIATEVVLWALGKLHDELMFYEEYDIRHGVERNDATMNQIDTVASIRNSFLNGDLVVATKGG